MFEHLIQNKKKYKYFFIEKNCVHFYDINPRSKIVKKNKKRPYPRSDFLTSLTKCVL